MMNKSKAIPVQAEIDYPSAHASIVLTFIYLSAEHRTFGEEVRV